jgi:hypothetical protein
LAAPKVSYSLAQATVTILLVKFGCAKRSPFRALKEIKLRNC